MYFEDIINEVAKKIIQGVDHWPSFEDVLGICASYVFGKAFLQLDPRNLWIVL